jgi:hypothetical protein
MELPCLSERLESLVFGLFGSEASGYRGGYHEMPEPTREWLPRNPIRPVENRPHAARYSQ